MAPPTLIFCAAGNRRLAQIAVDAGFTYGARLPDTVYTEVAPLYFADQDWRRPDRTRYMAGLAQHRPTLATVLDWETPEQLPEVLDWAEEAAQYVQRVLIIPKVIGGIARLPRHINGTPLGLAYSVPSKYAGTNVPLWEFKGWYTHLLGGSPQRQLNIARYTDIHSVDGNMPHKMATRYCSFWTPQPFTKPPRHTYWPTLQQYDRATWGKDAPYEALRRSCHNIVDAWAQLHRGTL